MTPDPGPECRPRGAAGDTGQEVDPGDESPWTRFGWLLWATWLVFLVFPFYDAATADRAAPSRWITIGLLSAFGVVYALSAARLASGDQAGWHRASWLRLGVLTVLALTTVPVLGLGALSLLPFLQSFAVFALPRPWNWAWAATGIGVALLTPVAQGTLGEWIYLDLVIIGVTAGAGGGRLMADHGQRYAMVSEQLTVAAERERVARDVHDVLGHSLTVVTVKAELAERLVTRDPERAVDELRQIQDLSRQALAEVRAAVGGLRIARLPDELSTAATALASAGITAALPNEPSVLDPRHRPVAAWLVREAVTNVVRHSGAGRCEVTVEPSAVRVTDNGRGLDGSLPGNGLRGLRERVEQSGARLTVEPGPAGVGTVVEARW